MPTAEEDEIVATLDHARACLEELAVRGLRAAEPESIRRLRALRDELARIGADHLAARLGALLDAIDDVSGTPAGPEAAKRLLAAQTSLRLFERVLTVEAARRDLPALTPAPDELDDDADDEAEEMA
ncbi:MAG TPA: hypothetical protein VN903_09965 [Polyangia bacterium]|nr:hypothetical protein [Polyangia bacterium]